MYDPSRHHRRSIRLKDYDYTQAGAYFVTLCVQDRGCLFGDIEDGVMRLNDVGQIVDTCWQWLALQYDHVELDAWVVMPDHMHGIVVLTDDGGGGACRGGSRRGGSRTAPTCHPPTAPASTIAITDAPKRKPLGRLIGAFKTVSTKRINGLHGTPGRRLWQRGYYERIIRDASAWVHIRRYILDNPRRWAADRNRPNG